MSAQEMDKPVLRLEFTCTPKERSEAQTLCIRHQLGGGSKWMTWVVLLAMLAGVIWLLWIEFLKTMPAGHRMYGIGAVVAVWMIFILRDRRRRRREGPPAVMELFVTGIRG